MNADEMNWLLQTIEEPETARSLMQAQYKRGRISYDLLVHLARQHGWTDFLPVRRRFFLRSNTPRIADDLSCRSGD